MNTKVPRSIRTGMFIAGGMLTAAIAHANPIGYATLNGGTTGGAGGEVVYASTGAEINQAMCNRASEDTPLIIYVSGTINHGNTAKYSGSCDTAADEIQFKGVSNISLIGVGSGAVFDQIGIHLRDASNIILQNLHIKNVKKSGSPTSNGGDAIGMESGVYNVWVDHCELEASGGESAGYDSLLDMKATTQYVTVSYTYYHDSGRGGLMGSSDSDDSNTFVTFHHNYYENVESRMPLLRHGTAHAFNNYYNGILKSGMNPRIGGKIKAEHNHFQNANNPIGTFYTSDMGYWDLKDNIFENVTWTTAADETPAGPNPVSTTSISIPYSYKLDPVNCVRDIVKATAGVGKGLAVSNGTCSVTSSSSSVSPTSSSSSSNIIRDSSSSSQIVRSSSSITSTSSSTDSGPGELGTNFALSAGADGTSKGGGTSYGSIIDGQINTYWQPSSTSGQRVSVKGLTGSFNTVIIRELNGATTSWRLVNNDNGTVLATGTTLGSERVIRFNSVTASKVNLMIDSASSAPQIAEFEVYNATGTIGSSSSAASQTPTSASPSSAASAASSTAPVLTVVQAETADSYQGSIDNIHSGFTGTGFIDFENVSGSYVEWNLNRASAALVNVTFYFANGSTANRAVDVIVNGNTQARVDFNGTGAWNSWSSSMTTLSLQSGNNVVRLVAVTSSGGPNLDRFELEGAVSIPSSSSSSVTIPASSASSVVTPSSRSSSSVATTGQQCNWYGTLYPLCVTTMDGWGWEGNASCISRATCSSQPAPWGIVGDNQGSSSSVVRSSSSVAVIGSSSSVTVIPSSSSSVSSVPRSSSSASSIDYSGPISNECINLATNPNINWRDTSLQSDQEIVTCLSQTLGQPVGYGENARGGFDPNGNSKLTIITKNSAQSVEEQILAAITGDEHNWIVFDKFDFADKSEIGMYRLQCGNSAVQSHLGATEAECINYTQWCSKKGISGEAACLDQFFNKALNSSALPIRNVVIGSNKTLDGRMSEAFFRFSGFALGRDSSGVATQTATSVILTHLDFQGAGHTEDHGLDPDMIRVTGESHDVWIHKNTFDLTGDSAFDVKVGAYDITMSFNEVIDVLRASLHGSSDSRTINEQITTTMHHNAFVTRDAKYDTFGNTGRRVPLIRRGTSHMFNNVFVNYRKDVLSIRVGADLLWEDNMFVVNQSLQEKSTLESSLSELQSNLIKDISGGSFRADGVYLWFADGACNLNAATKTPMTASSGSVGNIAQNYSAASQTMINAQRIDAGQDLVDYVSATAGKYGQVPFNSPLSFERDYVLGLGKVSCQ